jgi:hypothetical protein
MDPFGDDDIARLLRLKRYEQPPPAYFENFLSEFRRRQRDELLRQPVWRICFERAHGFALRHNVRPYPAGVAGGTSCRPLPDPPASRRLRLKKSLARVCEELLITCNKSGGSWKWAVV